MCRDWKQKGSNHHFPELNRKRKISKMMVKFFTPSRVTMVMVAFTVIVGVTYLMQTNIAATKGYKIKDLEKNINELQERNKKLNLKYIELQSMANVIDSVSDLNLVATDNIEVITPVGSAVALR
jgi:cell division protein FtsL